MYSTVESGLACVLEAMALNQTLLVQVSTIRTVSTNIAVKLFIMCTQWLNDTLYGTKFLMNILAGHPY